MSDLDVGVRIGIEGAAAAGVLLNDLNRSLTELQKTGQINPIQAKELVGEFKVGALKSFEEELRSVAKEANLTSKQVDAAVLHMRHGMDGLRSNRMSAAEEAIPAVFRSNRGGGSDVAATLAAVAIQNKGMQEFTDKARDAAITQKRLAAAHAEAIVMNEAFDKALKKTGGSLSEVGGISKRTAQDFVQLGRAAAQGDITGMAMNAGQLALAFRGAGVAVLGTAGAIAAAVGVMGKAFYDGVVEQRAMQSALVATGNISGQTEESMLKLSKAISDSGRMTIGTAKDIVTQLAASGQLGQQSIQAVAQLAERYARTTGKDVEKVGPELAKIFAEPGKGAEQLNSTMHTLTVTQVEYIKSLERTGEVEKARLELAKLLETQLKKDIQNIGYLEQAWLGVRKAVSQAWDSMTQVGKADTLEGILAAATRNRDAAAARLKTMSAVNETAGGAATSMPTDIGAARRKQAEEELQDRERDVILAQRAVNLRNAEVKTGAEQAAQNSLAAKAQESINKAATYRITLLQDELTQILKNGEASADKDRKVYELQKQIREEKYNLNAESRQMQNADIDGVLKVQAVYSQGIVSRINSLSALDLVLKEQHSAEINRMEVEDVTYQLWANRQRQWLEQGNPQRLRELKNEEVKLEMLKEQTLEQGKQIQQLNQKNRIDNNLKVESDVLVKQREVELSAQNIATEFARTQNEKIKGMEFELSMLSKTSIQQQTLTALRQEDLDVQRQLLAVQALMFKEDPLTGEQTFIGRDIAEYNRLIATIERTGQVSRARMETVIPALAEEKIRVQGVQAAMTSLGQTFSSAFEEALVGGKSLRDILKGTEQDLLRIGTRLLITDPFKRGLYDMIKSSDGSPGGILNAFGSKIGGWLGIGGGAGSPDIATMAAIANADLAAGGVGYSFASGGSFTVGGSGGTDSQFVGFKASPDETVTIETPAQRRARSSGNTSRGLSINGPLMVINTPDANSFQRNMNQVSADMFALISAQQARFR